MATGKDFVLQPEMHSKKLLIQYKENTYQNYFDKIYTADISTSQLKNTILSPLINTVLFEEKDASLMHVSSQGISTHDIDGFEYAFHTKTNILSIALGTIFQYGKSLKTHQLYINNQKN